MLYLSTKISESYKLILHIWYLQLRSKSSDNWRCYKVWNNSFFKLFTSWCFTNVFYRYFAHYDYFDRAESSVFQVQRQRQRDQSSHLFAIWCVWKLLFMIVSSRTKSNLNYLRNSSQLDCLHKCTFRVFESHD